MEQMTVLIAALAAFLEAVFAGILVCFMAKQNRIIKEQKKISDLQAGLMEEQKDLYQKLDGTSKKTELESDDVDEALKYIHGLRKRFRKHLKRLADYIQRNREGIWYKEAREKGIPIGSGSADKAGDILICRRMKLRGMRWSRANADKVLSIRMLVLNGEWDDFWQTYKQKHKHTYKAA